EIATSAMQGDVFRLTDATRSGTFNFLVDDATTVHFSVTTSTDQLAVNIVTPNSTVIDATNVGALGGAYFESTDPQRISPLFGGPGNRFTFVFPNQGAGNYIVNFSYPGGTVEEVVFGELIQDSPVQATLFSNDAVTITGGNTNLTLGLIESGLPVTNASILLFVQIPGAPSFTMGMTDDGQNADTGANDGLYTATIPTPVAGEYYAMALISGQTSGALPFVRTAATKFDVLDPMATFLSTTFGEQAIDDNGNTFYYRVEFTASVDVMEAGDYVFEIDLLTPMGLSLAATGQATLGLGSQLITADLSASELWYAGEDGPYTIIGARLTYIGPNEPSLAASEEGLSQATAAYQLIQFDRPPLEMTGNNSDVGVDTDGDAEFNRLDVSLGMNVLYGGTYDYSAELYDSNGDFIQQIEGQQTFQQQTLDAPLILPFPGEPIRAYAADGPLFVKKLAISGAGEMLTVADAYETQPYSASAFDQQNGSAMMIIVFNNTGQKASDLHLTFEGGQGSVIVDPNTIIGGCSNPSIPSNPPTMTDTVVIDWGTPCVEIGGAVALIVRSDFGPLRYVSGWWSGPGGVNIGDISRNDIYINEIDLKSCVGPVTLRIERACVPQGPITCGPLVRRPGYSCWWRKCTMPWTLYWYRAQLCCAMSLAELALGMETCIYATPWVPGELVPPFEFWLRVTNPKPSELPVPGRKPIGHFPANPTILPEFATPIVRDVRMVVTEDEGQTWRSIATLETTFSKMAQVLRWTGNDPEAYQGGYVPTLQFMAPRYFQASGLAAELVEELQLAIDTTQDPTLIEIEASIAVLAANFGQMGGWFTTGFVEGPEPFEAVQQALLDMAEVIQSQDNLAHLSNAADTLISLARGFEVSAEHAAGDLSDPIEQDFFLWGLNNRFEMNAKHLGTAFGPHVRLHLTLPEWVWYRSTIDAVQVEMQDPATFDILERSTYHMSDRSEIDLPLLGSKPLNLWIKLPTHLSRVISTRPLTRGQRLVVPGKLIAGDVNNDNVINVEDLEMVLADLGSGGADAESVPPTDVDGDGVVNALDAMIVYQNLGKVGEALPQWTPPIQQAPVDATTK
ncbi:MAG: choice-of-anchor X domain-containing protein, partial [Planctomycetota bacterium]